MCKENECSKKVVARGRCGMHYRRWRVNGDPQIVRVIREDPEAAFWSKVVKDQESGCWLWTGRINSRGYGEIQRDSRKQPVHVWAYRYFIGEIPEGYQIDHVKSAGCVYRNCVNYENHLEAVTPLENILRSDGPAAINSRKTHCPQGHPYDEENTENRINSHTGKPYRNCKICRKLQNKEYQRKLRAKRKLGDAK